MKARYITRFVSTLAFLLLSARGQAQSTFVYDQQSSTESNVLEGTVDIQQTQPMGQSFTPQLSSVGFIRLVVNNGAFGNTSAATIDVNLRANSITGTILGTSEQISIPGGSLFVAPITFDFATPVSVTPGISYFFQPVVLDNNNLMVNADAYNYSGGTAFFNGAAAPASDLWFREGITVIPEPGLVSLLVVSALTLLGLRRRN